MTLRLSLALRRAIEDHAESTYPEECCGLLIGIDAAGERHVHECAPATNERGNASRHNRYLISPEFILWVQKEARSKGREVIGYYHSHPDHPAVPSDFDREHAWPGTSYLIVSVRAGAVADARSWRLVGDRTGFEEEPVTSPASAAKPAHESTLES